jgi:hypothetical protein
MIWGDVSEDQSGFCLGTLITLILLILFFWIFWIFFEGSGRYEREYSLISSQIF